MSHQIMPSSHCQFFIGWDGGRLAPGHLYRRQMDSPGLYIYDDGLGHQAQICVTPREDVNGDGFVDLLDIQAVAAAWGSLAPGMDIDLDGDVDIVDTMRVTSRWGWLCAPQRQLVTFWDMQSPSPIPSTQPCGRRCTLRRRPHLPEGPISAYAARASR